MRVVKVTNPAALFVIDLSGSASDDGTVESHTAAEFNSHCGDEMCSLSARRH